VVHDVYVCSQIKSHSANKLPSSREDCETPGSGGDAAGSDLLGFDADIGDDESLSDGDPDSSSDDGGCRSEREQHRPSASSIVQARAASSKRGEECPLGLD
jgi:hypothetical protein